MPQCVTLTVATAGNKSLDLTFWAYFDANVNVTAAQQIQVAINALNNWLPVLPIGGITIGGVCTNVIPINTLRDVLSDQFVADGYGRPLLIKITNPSSDFFVGVGYVAEPGANIFAQAA